MRWPGDDDVPGVDAPPGSWEGRPGDRYALDADLDLYWPAVRPCWEERLPGAST